LADYYRLRESFGADGLPAVGESVGFEEFDHPTFRELYVVAVPGGLRVEFYLPAVHCAACVWLIERLPSMVPGVIDARVRLSHSTVEVTWRPEATPLSAIARTLDQLGYTPHAVSPETWKKVHDAAARRELGWLAVAGACAGNNMLLALALYAGEFSGMAAEHASLFRWASTLVGLISLIGPGRVFFRGAVGAIRSRTPHLDIPLALGLGVGGIGGVVHAITGQGEIYFDSLSVLVFLLLLGRFIQARGQRMSAESVSLLRLLTPRRAHRVVDDMVENVPIEAIGEGDVLEVRVGEMIPADGLVTSGESSVDESLLTGETLPREVAVGAELTAGSMNQSAVLRMTVSSAGQRTRMGKLALVVEGASRERAKVLDLAHRWSGYFVVVVLCLAILTAILWVQVSVSLAFEYVVALLVVSCPCALGLATPLALAVAQGRAARRRILIKGSEVFEKLAGSGRIWLDKTGTLTEGRLRLRSWEGDFEVQSMVAALERESTHPIARSLVKEISERLGQEQIDRHEVDEVRHCQGGGISGRVDDRHVEVGSARRLDEIGWTWSDSLRTKVRDSAQWGWTPVVIGVDGEVVAVVGMGDEIRAEAKEAVASLRRFGWRVGILSGDHPAIVSRVGTELGLPAEDCLGGLSPEEKFGIVRSGVQHQNVVMVGDGINDSAALAWSSVGIAVQGGAEASMNSAMVYLGEPGLLPLVELVEGSRRTMKVVRRNLAASLFYNMLAAGLSVSGLISPLLAALLMPASSLTVVSLSTASRTFGGKR
jgi:Cu2+-exporting ATPase